MAAQVTIVYDEPTAAGNDCDHLRIYACYGTACSANQEVARLPASDANCGQANRNLVFNMDIDQTFVPGPMCFRVSIYNTAGNGSPGVISCVTAQTP
jgi:hypothetical protein